MKILLIENGIKWKLEYKRVLDYIDVNRRGGNVHVRFKSTKFLSLRIIMCYNDDNSDGDGVLICFSFGLKHFYSRKSTKMNKSIPFVREELKMKRKKKQTIKFISRGWPHLVPM